VGEPAGDQAVDFSGPITEGLLLRRYQRFLADVRLNDEITVTAHCANPGSMLSCLEPGTRAWLTRANSPARKLGWTWEVAERGRTRIYVNPVGVNAVVAEALAVGRVKELRHYRSVRREARWGDHSRLDFLLSRGQRRCYVEVKSATLALGGGRTAFPDAVTARGTKHLEALMQIRAAGHRAVLLFCASRNDTRSVEPADFIDPEYGATLRRAAAARVELLAYKVRITRRGVTLWRRVPVVL
jgi:sugar fermentation stimulation protein A